MAKGAYIGVENFTPIALPSGYTQVEYIESSGTQYINTGFKANQNTRVKMKFTYKSGDVVFGAYDAGGSNAYALQAVSGKWYTYHGNSNATSSIAVTAGNTYEVDMNKNTTYIDGALARTANVNTFAGSYPILLSCLYNGTSGAGVYTSLRIYYCQIYDNGTLVRDYVPCKNSSGTVGLYDIKNGKFYTNAGSGTFTAGAAHGSVARKVKKGYIGVDGLARKIKKAYIGIGGIARPCWSGGELAYYGTITPLSKVRYDIDTANVGDYALFVGGHIEGTSQPGSQAVEAYNSSLVHSETYIPSQGWFRGAANIGDYAIFAGGVYNLSNSMHASVTAYNSSLSQTNPMALNEGLAGITGATIGNYAILCGGYRSSGYAVNTIHAYDSSLTQNTTSKLPSQRMVMSATKLGDNVLFAGGQDYYGNYVGSVYSCNASLTFTTRKSLSVSRIWSGAVTIGNHALFGGGNNDRYNTNNHTDVIDVYDTSFTRTNPISLSVGKSAKGAATTLGEYALFGPFRAASTSRTSLDAFDSSLTKFSITELQHNHYGCAAATIGNYAIFAGSNASTGLDGEGENYVEVYTVV